MVAVKEPVGQIEIAPNQKLLGIRKEYHTRRSLKGSVPIYVVEDKQKQQLILAQKLALLATHINANVAADRTERVSITGLHQIISSGGALTGGFTKYRFKVHPFTIEEAAPAFERMRLEGYGKCVVVGSPSCYQVA